MSSSTVSKSKQKFCKIFINFCKIQELFYTLVGVKTCFFGIETKTESFFKNRKMIFVLCRPRFTLLLLMLLFIQATPRYALPYFPNQARFQIRPLKCVYINLLLFYNHYEVQHINGKYFYVTSIKMLCAMLCSLSIYETTTQISKSISIHFHCKWTFCE